jgi:hypothetical protein
VILIKEERPYGEVTGVIWLQTNCQPEAVFAKTMLLWNWPLVALPLYWPFSVARTAEDKNRQN